MDSSRQLQATNEGKWRFLGMDGKRWILIVSFLGCIQGKSVVKLVGRQGNAGVGEVAAAGRNGVLPCIIAWKLILPGR